MRKRSVLLFLFVNLMFSFNVKAFDYVQRGLLIFLDDSEQEIPDAISGAFLTALSQQAGPIVVSQHLVKHVLQGFNVREGAGKSAEKIKQMGESESIKERSFAYVTAADFDENQWIFKKINNALFLLIPKKILGTINIDEKEIVSSGAKSITKIELSFGLKVNHMPTEKLEDIIDSNAYWFKQDLQREYKNYFVDYLADIFVTRSDYKQQELLPEWSIFMGGHGKLGNTIVALKLSDFVRVLSFFEKKINTKLLFYYSCYAAGQNAELIFKDLRSPWKKPMQKAYSFAIVTQAITDAPVSTLKLSLGIKRQKGLYLKGIVERFDLFLKNVTASSVVNYAQVIKDITPLSPNEKSKSYDFRNIPQIKMPALEWFSVLESPKKIVQIGSILAKTRDKPLDVTAFFKTDPRVLLLHAQDIPFELIINSNNLAAIISMVPSSMVFHTIKGISSSQNSALQIMDWFINIMGDLEGKKIFYIKNIKGKDEEVSDVIIYNYQEFIPSLSKWFPVRGALYLKNGELKGRTEVKRLIGGFFTGKEEDASMQDRRRYKLLLKEIAEKSSSKSVLTLQAIENIKQALAKGPQRRQEQQPPKQSKKTFKPQPKPQRQGKPARGQSNELLERSLQNLDRALQDLVRVL